MKMSNRWLGRAVPLAVPLAVLAGVLLGFSHGAFAADAPPPPPACATGVTGPCTPNSGDTAWMLTSMALVLMMTIPGLGLFYGGMVRKKNVLTTEMQSFAITCLVTILWFIVGY